MTDDRVETSNIFDKCFFKVQRKTGQTLMEYVTEFHQALREVSRLKVSLPDGITGWLLLRRAALTKDQQHLVQTQVGRNLTLKNVEQSIYQVFGQDYRQTYLPNTNKAKGFAKGKGRQHIMHADDSYDDGSEWQEYYETDEVYWEAAGESPDHEEYYDPNDETWDDTYYETEGSYTRMNRSLTSKSMMRPTRPTPMPSCAYSSFVRPEASIQLWLSWTTSRCLLLRQALEVRKARAKSQRNPPKLHCMLRVRVLRLEPSLSLAMMFVCVVAKLAIERPAALNLRALRHRAPARSVSLILIPWWTWSSISSLLHLASLIFTFFIIIFIFLIWQFFQRMTWSLRSSFGSTRTVSPLLQSTSTRTEPDGEIPKMRQHLENQRHRHRINMLTQQLHDKDDKITDLQQWIDYYQGDLALTPIWVSRAGERFHVRLDQNVIPFGMPIPVASEGLHFAHTASEICIRQRWLMTLAISLSPTMWIWCRQISANSVIARKSSWTPFTFGTCLHRPLQNLGFCGASALFIRVHRALEHYQSYGDADKTEVFALHIALVHFQLCSALRAVETRRSLSISSQE